MRPIRVDNYIINTPIKDILERLRISLTNGKLKEIGSYSESSTNIVVTCPHHDGGHETKAACNIYIGNDTKLEYGYFRCFVCGEQGSFVKFVSECFDSSEAYAKHWLISNFGTLSFEKISLGEPIDLAKAKKDRNIIVLDEAVLNEYQSWHPYLGQRNLTRETCEKFKVKYDPKTRQIVFPTYDPKNRLIMLPKRSIDKKIFYLDKDVEKPVYCLNNIINNNYKKAIITEGPFDCLLANQYGIPACATLGTISDHQIRQLNNSCLTTVYAMFDNDEAGRKFTEVLKKKLSKRIIVEEIKIPNGKKDIGDLSYIEFWDALNKSLQK